MLLDPLIQFVLNVNVNLNDPFDNKEIFFSLCAVETSIVNSIAQ